MKNNRKKRQPRIDGASGRLIQAVWNNLAATGDWPTPRAVEYLFLKEAAKRGGIRAWAKRYDAKIIYCDSPDQETGECRLGLSGWTRCEGADHYKKIVVSIAQTCARRYRDARGGPARFSREDYQALQLSELEGKVLDQLGRTGLHFRGSGSSQEFSIDRFAAHLDGLKDFDDYMARLRRYEKLRQVEMSHHIAEFAPAVKDQGEKSNWDLLLSELCAPRYAGPLEHARKARGFMADSRDPLNALKEVACTAEAIARIILGDPTLTLGDATNLLRRAKRLEPTVAKIVEGFWAFSSNLPGSRHGAPVNAPVPLRQVRLQFDHGALICRQLLMIDLPMGAGIPGRNVAPTDRMSGLS